MQLLFSNKTHTDMARDHTTARFFFHQSDQSEQSMKRVEYSLHKDLLPHQNIQGVRITQLYSFKIMVSTDHIAETNHVLSPTAPTFGRADHSYTKRPLHARRRHEAHIASPPCRRRYFLPPIPVASHPPFRWWPPSYSTITFTSFSTVAAVLRNFRVANLACPAAGQGCFGRP